MEDFNNQKPKERKSSISIQNFKSILKNFKLDFSNRLNILIGQNEVGKSNILDAFSEMEKDKLELENQNCNSNNDQNLPSCITYSFSLSTLEDVLKEELINWFQKILFTDYYSLWKDNFEKIVLPLAPNQKKINIEDILNKLNKNQISADSFQLSISIDCNGKSFLYPTKNSVFSFFLSLSLSLIFQTYEKAGNNSKEQKEVYGSSFLSDPKKKNQKNYFWQFLKEKFNKFHELRTFWGALGYTNVKKQKIAEQKIQLFIQVYEKTIDFYKEKNLKVIFFQNKNFKSEYNFSEVLEDKFFLGFWKKTGQSIKILRELVSKSKKQDERFSLYTERLEKRLNKSIKQNIHEDKYFWSQKTFNLKIKINNDRFIFHIKDYSEDEELEENEVNILKYSDFKRRSEGLKRYLYLLLFIYSFDYSEYKNFVILLDEPDIGLSPKGIIDLKKNLEIFLEEKKNCSIIIATHNPFWIDGDNINQITVVKQEFQKEFKAKGTEVANNLLSSSNEPETSTLSYFLHNFGLYPEFFSQMSTSTVVFVEGYIDVLLFDGMKNYLNNKEKIPKYKNLFFISTDGAAKKSTLPNLFFAMHKRLPFFIFDYDLEGFKGIKRILREITFYENDFEKRVFFNNFENFNNWKTENEFEKNYKEEDKLETQHLFGNDKIENQKISELNKSAKEFFHVFEALKNKKQKNIKTLYKLKLSRKTKQNFKKIFDYIVDTEDDFQKN